MLQVPESLLSGLLAILTELLANPVPKDHQGCRGRTHGFYGGVSKAPRLAHSALKTSQPGSNQHGQRQSLAKSQTSAALLYNASAPEASIFTLYQRLICTCARDCLAGGAGICTNIFASWPMLRSGARLV